MPESPLFPMTWPMGLTMLRLLLLPVFVWLLLIDASQSDAAHPHRWWAVGVFAVMAITDKLDGYLARKLNQTSRLGALLDPIADKLLVATSLVLLSSSLFAPRGFVIPLFVVAAVYGKDLILALGFLGMMYLLGKVTIKPRAPGKIGTFLQLILVMLTLIAPDLAELLPAATQQTLTILAWSVATVAIVSCIDYVWVGWRQFVEQRRSVGAGS